jgi:hypothetical protein
MRFNDLCNRVKDGSVKQIIITDSDLGPYYDILYIHTLDDGVYAQKGDLRVKVNAAQLAKLISISPPGTQINQPDKLVSFLRQVKQALKLTP